MLQYNCVYITIYILVCIPIYIYIYQFIPEREKGVDEHRKREREGKKGRESGGRKREGKGERGMEEGRMREEDTYIERGRERGGGGGRERVEGSVKP